ncbi:MAG: pseudouridine synthase [Pseudomonadota bacterium]|nr:pseudouridine synthase [Pseudomonadota bacterium]
MSKIILFNKPYGVLTQFTDQRGRPTLGDYIPIKDVYPAGRLDIDSEGLVVLTDDGQLQHQIANPKFKLAKTYWVQVEGRPDEASLNLLQLGVKLKDGKAQPALARMIPEPKIWEREPPVRFRAKIPTTWLEITVREGKNRLVRRMTAAIGYPTLRLIRYSVGDWTLDNLPPGEWQEMLHTPAKLT